MGVQERSLMPEMMTCSLILVYDKDQPPAQWCLWLSPVSAADYFSPFLFEASRLSQMNE